MTDTVTVACKLPNGLRLRLFEFKEEREATPLGFQTIKVGRPIEGQEVVINGTAIPFGQQPEEPHIAGYALTYGVPKYFWDTWCEQNQDNDCLLQGLIFAHSEMASVKAEAKEHRSDGLKSGMEPIDPKSPPKGISLRGMKIETADE